MLHCPLCPLGCCLRRSPVRPCPRSGIRPSPRLRPRPRLRWRSPSIRLRLRRRRPAVRSRLRSQREAQRIPDQRTVPRCSSRRPHPDRHLQRRRCQLRLRRWRQVRGTAHRLRCPQARLCPSSLNGQWPFAESIYVRLFIKHK